MRKGLGRFSTSQSRREEAVKAAERVGGIIGSVAGCVVDILKGMAGQGIDLVVHGPAKRLHGGLNGVDRVGWNATILTAKIAQHGGVDLAQGGLVCGQFRVAGPLAVIEIDGQRHIALGCTARGLLLDPVIPAPPLMEEDQGQMGTSALGQIEQRLGRRIAAGEGDRLLRAGIDGEQAKQHGNGEEENAKMLHGKTPVLRRWIQLGRSLPSRIPDEAGAFFHGNVIERRAGCESPHT